MDMNEFLGKRFSLISKSSIRWVGTLVKINPDDSTIELEHVISHGTENRVKDPARKIPPISKVYEHIVFRGSDVEEISVQEEEEEPEPPLPNDPAIVDGMPPPPFSQAPGFPPDPRAAHAFHGWPQQPFPGYFPPYNRYMPPGFPPPPGFPMPYGAPGWFPPPGNLQAPGQFNPSNIPIVPPQGMFPMQQQQQQQLSSPAQFQASPQQSQAPVKSPPGTPGQKSVNNLSGATSLQTPATPSAQAAATPATGPPTNAFQTLSTPNNNASQTPSQPPAPVVPLTQNNSTSAVASTVGETPSSSKNALSAMREDHLAAAAAVATAMEKLPRPTAQQQQQQPQQQQPQQPRQQQQQQQQPEPTPEAQQSQPVQRSQQQAASQEQPTQTQQTTVSIESVSKITEPKSEQPRNVNNTGRGAHRCSRPGYRGAHHGQGHKIVVPSTPFDFETANAKFRDEKLQSHANQDSRQSTPSSAGTPGYNPKSSFFDNISSEIRDREEGLAPSGGREWRAEEENKNMETFGQRSVGHPRFRGRGRARLGGGRGRGGSRGGRGFERGGYNSASAGGNARANVAASST